jgi:2-amino-4-hydroxy-6-hydroxymethyldihydropteridine diphosphokinase
MTRFAVALGSNLGDRLDHLRRAVEEMGALGEVEAISGLYETEPVGGPDQGPYLNAVVLLETDLPPARLLASLQGIERTHDRVRTARWGPRTLDLDIVAIDDESIDTPELVVPHPRAAERRFVLQPLCDVWPEAWVGDGMSALQAMGEIEDRGVELIAPVWASR